METAHMEPVIDHTKGASDFMADSTGPSFYEPLSSLEYLQYPQSPFGVSTINREFKSTHFANFGAF